MTTLVHVEPAQKKKEEPKQESDTEHESGSEESDGDQKVPLLDQPLELSGARDRKQVDRFNADLLKGGRRHYDIEIPAGKGTRLKDIPSISYELKKSGVDDLKTLHRIMYSRIGNVSNINQNILMFNGFSFDKNSIPYRRTHTALSKLNMNKLKSISQVLCLPKAGKQAHYIERILDFLLEPTDTGKAVRESRPERKGAHSKSYKEAR
ncbi:hypothetical protein LSTR_LSTR016728 [Laodelphax striatellus]|uniref:SAP domain-containing protein n=1 Tax=Laodelphax striatellus TaxID=195883 RepID=A0A482XKP1_LAOST|nr:hypothetical protein LSTR_LSTR016728 [Laodelphax striatellus]